MRSNYLKGLQGFLKGDFRYFWWSALKRLLVAQIKYFEGAELQNAICRRGERKPELQASWGAHGDAELWKSLDLKLIWEAFSGKSDTRCIQSKLRDCAVTIGRRGGRRQLDTLYKLHDLGTNWNTTKKSMFPISWASSYDCDLLHDPRSFATGVTDAPRFFRTSLSDTICVAWSGFGSNSRWVLVSLLSHAGYGRYKAEMA